MKFLKGVATSAYQIEGAYNEDGKELSVWDIFCSKKGNIKNNDNGNIACDHYHRYKEDIKLMKELGIKAYRFSISWPRIYPNGKLNKQGIDFYKNLVIELKKHNIEPIATLYHWDLPYHLQKIGGWLNRKTIDEFEKYSKTMFKELKEVKFWITHNEPWCSAFLGYEKGIHAPGIKSFRKALQVAHNILVSHGKAVQAYRKLNLNGKIGIALNINKIEYFDKKIVSKIRAKYLKTKMFELFLDPLLKGKYPLIFKILMKTIKIEKNDLKTINEKIDFLGINYYTRELIKGFGYGKSKNKYTEMGWEVYPSGIYDVLKEIREKYGDVELYITENGCAFKDVVKNGKINDKDRIKFFKEHLKWVKRAKDELNLKGYLVWSLLDNFEWAEGYTKRFGIVYVDYETQKRIPKNSAYWLKENLFNNSKF